MKWPWSRINDREQLGLVSGGLLHFSRAEPHFQDMAIHELGTSSAGSWVNVIGRGKPEHLPALKVTDGLLPIWGVTPLFGRSFTREDDSPGSPETVTAEAKKVWRFLISRLQLIANVRQTALFDNHQRAAELRRSPDRCLAAAV